MGELPARVDGAAEGVLADAAHRLDRALQTLEAALARPHAPASQSPAGSAQVVDLEAARRRGRELELAAAEASQALGRAAAQVQLALEADGTAEPHSQRLLFDWGRVESALESGPLLPDEEEAGADDSAPEEEPTA